MKFITKSILIIALALVFSKIQSFKITELSEYGSLDPDLESLIQGYDDKNGNSENNNENIFEDLNFLENRNLIKNETGVNATDKDPTATDNPIVDLNGKNIDFSGWFSVSNVHFNDPKYFPLGTKSLKKEVDFSNLFGDNFLINQVYKEGADAEVKNELMFFFRYKNGLIYFTNKKDSMSIIDSLRVSSIRNSDKIISKISSSDTCFDVIDTKSWTWTLCATNIDLKKKWLCSLEKHFKQNMDSICNAYKINNETFKLNNNSLPITKNSTKQIKNIFIIPKESPRCNANWNYQKNGADWECTCSEGIYQSPINLPNPKKNMITKSKPLFLYDIIEPISKVNSIDGLMKENEPIKIYNKDGLLKIMHNNFGKIVLSDGGVYHGEEVVFHTPAEHTINGQKFDMEVQIIHYGVSKGDIAKQVILSFLFYVKPGVFNEFLDKIDVYNLPNEIDGFKDLTASLNLASIFYSNIKKNPFDEKEQSPVKDFSFYSYEGSLTSPPCTERTTVIVAAEPLPVSNTFVELFKEALRKPEYFGIDGKLYNEEDSPKLNARNIQPLNGRKITFYHSQGVN
jgi:carbonic anhydrase